MPYTYEYPKPSVTTDCLIFKKQPDGVEILLIERKHDPFKGTWALPGGFVDENEDLIDAANRELMEETSLSDIDLHQFYTYGTPGRDPRGHTISVVFYGFLQNTDQEVKAGDDAAKAKWFRTDQLPALAFDHDTIIKDAKEKLKI